MHALSQGCGSEAACRRRRTSRSRTGRPSSGRWRPNRCGSSTTSTPPTPSRRWTPCAAWARWWSATATRSSSGAAACATPTRPAIRSTSATPARSCACSRAGWPSSRTHLSRWTATPPSGGARWTASPRRSPGWAPCWTPPRGASRRSPCTAPGCTASPTSCRWPRPRSSRACSWPAWPPRRRPSLRRSRAVTTPSESWRVPAPGWSAGRRTAAATPRRSATPRSSSSRRSACRETSPAPPSSSPRACSSPARGWCSAASVSTGRAPASCESCSGWARSSSATWRSRARLERLSRCPTSTSATGRSWPPRSRPTRSRWPSTSFPWSRCWAACRRRDRRARRCRAARQGV